MDQQDQDRRQRKLNETRQDQADHQEDIDHAQRGLSESQRGRDETQRGLDDQQRVADVLRHGLDAEQRDLDILRRAADDTQYGIDAAEVTAEPRQPNAGEPGPPLDRSLLSPSTPHARAAAISGELRRLRETYRRGERPGLDESLAQLERDAAALAKALLVEQTARGDAQATE